MAEKTHSNRWVTSGLECLDVILGQVEPGGMGEVLGVERAGWRSTLERPEADTGRQSGDEIDSTKAEVYGPQDGSECCPYLLGLITQMEKRQERMHKSPPSLDHPRDKTGGLISRTFSMGPECGSGEGTGSNAHEKGEHLCLKMLAGTRKMVDGLDWD